jgi:type VII secretion protein EssA
MKLKWLIIGGTIFVSLLLNGNHTAATPNIENVTPNTYEKEAFKENTDFLHEKSLYENKEEIPEEQKTLTFKKTDYDPLKELQKQLFSGNTENNNTIAVKAEQLKLFTDVSEDDLYLEADSGSTAKQNTKLMIVYVCLLVVAIVVMLIFLIPRMVRGNQAIK